jgi:hypothetical protein
VDDRSGCPDIKTITPIDFVVIAHTSFANREDTHHDISIHLDFSAGRSGRRFWRIRLFPGRASRTW